MKMQNPLKTMQMSTIIKQKRKHFLMKNYIYAYCLQGRKKFVSKVLVSTNKLTPHYYMLKLSKSYNNCMNDVSPSVVMFMLTLFECFL